MTRGEGHLLPYGEQPEARTHLQERCEGRQIAGLSYLSIESLPPGWRGIVFDFTTSEALVVMAAPVIDIKFSARLAFRWIEAQKIFTKTMVKVYTQGQGRLEPDDFIKEQIQGEVIRYVITTKATTPEGGEQLEVEMGSGMRVWLRAHPSEEHPGCADIELQIVPVVRTRIGL